MTLENQKHLSWIYDRLVFKYKEDVDFDYMLRLKQIIEDYDSEYKKGYDAGWWDCMDGYHYDVREEK